MKKLKNKNGFTLIELIMVMIILGVLSGLQYRDTWIPSKKLEAFEDPVISNIGVAILSTTIRHP